MKAYANQAWSNQIPDVYGKTPAPVAEDAEQEAIHAFEHQELKLHPFDSAEEALVEPASAVLPTEVELDIDTSVETDADATDSISAAEIDDLMRMSDLPTELDDQAAQTSESTIESAKTDAESHERLTTIETQTDSSEEVLASVQSDTNEEIQQSPETDVADEWPDEQSVSQEPISEYVSDVTDPSIANEQPINETPSGENLEQVVTDVLTIADEVGDQIEPSQHTIDSEDIAVTASQEVEEDWENDLIAEEADVSVQSEMSDDTQGFETTEQEDDASLMLQDDEASQVTEAVDEPAIAEQEFSQPSAELDNAEAQEDWENDLIAEEADASVQSEMSEDTEPLETTEQEDDASLMLQDEEAAPVTEVVDQADLPEQEIFQQPEDLEVALVQEAQTESPSPNLSPCS